MERDAGQNSNDTIVARATPRGASALSVVRLSGPGALEIAGRVFDGMNLNEAASHTAHVGWLSDQEGSIDQVVCTVFRAPGTATGEDVVELSCHGGDVAADTALRTLLDAGARMAEPGEFTQRAFVNGKLDLAQAEAVAELIHARSERAGRISSAHLKGQFSTELSELRDGLIQLLSLIELELDFSEEDVAFADRDRLVAMLKSASSQLHALALSFRYGRALVDGIRVVIVGAPNAGKSTLMNALLGYDRVIVSQIPGTTRDEVEAHVQWNGVDFTFVDTAGRRETSDVIEAEGVRRSGKAASEADLVVELTDLQDPRPIPVSNAEESVPRVLVGNKADLVDSTFDSSRYAMVISASSLMSDEAALTDLMQLISKQTVGSDTQMAEHRVVTSQRQQAHIRAALAAIERANTSLNSGSSGDMISSDLRQVIEEIGAITGEITNEDILDSIFSRFCIGK